MGHVMPIKLHQKATVACQKPCPNDVNIRGDILVCFLGCFCLDLGSLLDPCGAPWLPFGPILDALGRSGNPEAAVGAPRHAHGIPNALPKTIWCQHAGTRTSHEHHWGSILGPFWISLARFWSQESPKGSQTLSLRRSGQREQHFGTTPRPGALRKFP